MNKYTRSDLTWIAISLGLTVFVIWALWGEPGSLWRGLVFAVMTLTLIASPLLRAMMKGKREKVEFDANGIRRLMTTGQIEAIRWDELDEIRIVTTDEGPDLDDVYWQLANRDLTKGCLVSNSAEGFQVLLRRIQQLPKFDNLEAARAMGSVTNDEFVVWRREDEGHDASKTVD